MEKEIKVLQLLNLDSGIRQSDISEQTGISVGKVNSVIKELLGDGYILKTMISRKPHYSLTEKGIDVLEGFIKSSVNKKIKLHKDEGKGTKQAVILAAGRNKDFEEPTGFLKIEETTLIERTVDLLYQNNIQEIIVVTGYKSESFEKLATERKLKLVNNDKYKWTGTMISLSLVSEYITGDFMLVEGDLLFEERAISQILSNNQRDSVLITNESGSGDEAFVEIRDGHLYKLSKDIHQLNKIDGEMIGISKISYEVFTKMMEEFKNNRNPYLNYEYILLDIARCYNIGYQKIDDLVWAEVDNMAQYENIINSVYPRMKRKELEIKIDNIRNTIVDSLQIGRESIEDIQPIGGMTNKNFKITVSGENFVLRLPGAGTEEMISRGNEKNNSEFAQSLGINTEVKYFSEATGVKIARFIENTETLNPSTAKKEENMRLVADVLRRFHYSGVELKNEFGVFKLIVHYEYLLDKYKGKNFEDYQKIRERVMGLERVLEKYDVEMLPCHCDTVPENFVKSGDEKIYLIDWEYSGMNDPMWDLGAHIIECGFSEDDEELFLSIYFDGKVEEKYRIRILINQILQDFLWSLWTNIKEARGDNFGTYGIDRYNRAKKNLQKLNDILGLNV